MMDGSPRSPSTSLSGLGVEVKSAFGSLPRSTPTGKHGAPSGTLQDDLLTAADSITNTMSSLVKELGDGKFFLGGFMFLWSFFGFYSCNRFWFLRLRS